MGKHREKREAQQDAAIRQRVATEILMEAEHVGDLDERTVVVLERYVRITAFGGTPIYIQKMIAEQPNRGPVFF